MGPREWTIGLALAAILAAPGAATAHPAAASAAGKRPEARLGQGVRPMPVAAHPLSASASASTVRRPPASELRATPPAGPVRTPALILSSLGMLGVIALRRLSRPF